MNEFLAHALLASLLAAGGEARHLAETRPVPGFQEAVERRRPRDPWFGEDKARHFGMSYAITTFTSGGARLAGAGDAAALPAALVVAGVAGIGKEVYDRRAGGLFSYRDLVADAVGIAAGVLVLRASR
jgi:uncharacterized protein YfiM (DUF2279 family)